MFLDYDTFLVALYTIVDDIYQQHFAQHKPNRPGPEPQLSDAEVLTIVICAQWSGWSERKMVCHAQQHWRSYFPKMLCQSDFNRRGRDLVGVLVRMVPLVARQLALCESQLRVDCEVYQAMDGLPVPLMHRCRGNKHRLFANEAGVGKGGSDHDWFYGCRLLIAVTRDGVITGFLLGPANTQERWISEAFLCWRHNMLDLPLKPADLPPPHPRKGDPKEYVGPTGTIWPRAGVGLQSEVPYIADGGFSGQVWISHWAADYGAQVLTPASYQGENAEALKHEHASWRHVVETVNEHLEQALHLFFPRARSPWGVLTRVAAKLAAFNLGILLNRMFGRPDFAIATLFSC